MQPRKAFQLCLFLIAGFAAHSLYGQDRVEITVDWIFGEESEQLTALPNYFWLDNGAAILFDLRKEKKQRTFEVFDPEKGVRQVLFDPAVALADLNRLLAKGSQEALAWPLEFDRQGRRAIYSFEDDLFLLDFTEGRFEKITDSPPAEKAVHFSPDGKRLAFVRENDLYVYSLSTRQEMRLTTDGSETLRNGTLSWVYWEEIFDRQDTGYWWSPDSGSIAFLQSDESMVDVMYFVDDRPVVPALIRQRYPKAGRENPKVKVGVLELGDGSIRWTELPAAEYIVRVKWLPDSARFSVQTLNRPQDQLDLYFVDRQSGQSRRVLTEKDPAWVNINDDLHFLPDSGQFIWHSERDGFAHLYRYSLDGRLLNQVTRGPWSVRSSGGVFWRRQAVRSVDEKDGWVYFTAMEKSPVERHLYRVRLDGSGMERLTKEPGTHVISFSPDSRFYIDSFSNSQTPPALICFDRDGTRARLLAPARTALLEGLNFQSPELLHIPTSDGFKMPAEILRPANFDPEKVYPMIYHVYGGPSAPTVFNAWTRDRYFDQILLRHGYLVVRFDHRSATAISKKLENRLNRLMSGPTELQDILDGVSWLKALEYVDPDRFGIWGWSGGGSFTLNAMTNSAEFKAGIAVAPVTDWSYYDTRWVEAAMKLPEDNPEGYERTSFVKSAPRLHGRLLLVHGTHDDNVHPQNSWAFIEALVQQNIQFDMMFYPARDHAIADRAARIHLYTRMLEFWRENL